MASCCLPQTLHCIMPDNTKATIFCAQMESETPVQLPFYWSQPTAAMSKPAIISEIRLKRFSIYHRGTGVEHWHLHLVLATLRSVTSASMTEQLGFIASRALEASSEAHLALPNGYQWLSSEVKTSRAMPPLSHIHSPNALQCFQQLNYRWINGWWLNWKGFGRKQSWPKWGAILAFS
jgi:hypothetical protein